MATPGVHVCLLSDQLLPNLIPVLMERPARVYLVATAEMVAKGRDKRMRRLLRRENIDTRIRGGAPSTRIKEIRRFADRLAQEMKKNEAGGTIVLNATGGTKLLSMGFVEVFRERLEGYPLRVVYTDTEHQVIETIVPREQEAVPMAGVLGADSYLAAQGMVLVSAESDGESGPAHRRAVRLKPPPVREGASDDDEKPLPKSWNKSPRAKRHRQAHRVRRSLAGQGRLPATVNSAVAAARAR